MTGVMVLDAWDGVMVLDNTRGRVKCLCNVWSGVIVIGNS